MSSKPRGFTLIEVIVVVSIIAVLAMMISPLINRHLDDARITRAASEAQTIATAMLNFNKDTGKWPIFQLPAASITTASAIFTTLYSPGTYPTPSVDTASWAPATSVRGSIRDQLEFNQPLYGTSGKFAWRGPYVTNIGEDPWGNAYVINASNLGFGSTSAAFVLSAGPDGTIQTTFTQSIGSGSTAIVVGGDDIAARVR